SMETCGVPAHWKSQGWDVNYILNEALRWHISSLNVKSSAIPPAWKSIFDDFQKHMGYRFELRRIEYPAGVRPGSSMRVSMWWVNSGVAPVYRSYILALSLHSPSIDKAVEIPADPRKWLPGDSLVEEDIAVPELPPGEYRLRVALLDPRTHQAAIKLGIAGRTGDGWYDLGPIAVRERSSTK
ncbi:MAG TPA: DUF4832 domain-containing protein, partial [Bryobacteraceae bacterium]|nr:DUF4832 domain-containing protein [Bryobacteraceae bacterium]